MPHYSFLPASTALVTDTVNVSMSPKDIEEQNRTGHRTPTILYIISNMSTSSNFRLPQSIRDTHTCNPAAPTQSFSALPTIISTDCTHTHTHQHQAEGYILLLAATFWLKDCGQNEMLWPLAQRTQCSSANQVWITGNKSKWAWLSYSLDWAIGNFRNSTA